MPTLSIDIIRDFGSLAALERQWWGLWHRAPMATPFQSPGWLLPWWEVFAPGELSAVAIWNDNTLVGLAPLYLEDGALGLRLLPLGIGISDYCDILIDPVFEQETGEAILAAVGRMSAWESWEVTDMLEHASALKLPVSAEWRSSTSQASVAPVVILPDTIEALADTIPRLRRRQVRRARREAAKIGDIGWKASDALLPELVRLHTLQWTSRGMSGVLLDERVGRFHAWAVPKLAVENLCRFYALLIGETIAAVYYGFIDRGRAYAYLTGYDPAFADQSPGLILVEHAIEQAIREGAREFHFLRGGEAHKYEWGATARWNTRREFTRQASPRLMRAADQPCPTP
jgi:CelD/BcsL family acetyltransferase involved in cellulose biosynthesis